MFIEFLSANLLPTLLFLIMFGMGMTLTVEDFKRITKSPSEVLIGLTSQVIVLPIIAFLISISLGLNPTQSVGLILLACCPGGATSNLFSHLAKADTALSITLTAFSSIITVFTVPFIINASLFFFFETGSEFSLPVLRTIVNIFKLTALPTVLGMFLKNKFPEFCKRSEPIIKWFSIIFIIIALAAMLKLVSEKEPILVALKAVGFAVILLNIISMISGYQFGRMFKMDEKRKITIGIETGIQNGVLGITIATAPNLLDNALFAIPSGVYGLVMCISGIFVINFSKKKLSKG